MTHAEALERWPFVRMVAEQFVALCERKGVAIFLDRAGVVDSLVAQWLSFVVIAAGDGLWQEAQTGNWLKQIEHCFKAMRIEERP